MTKNMTIAKLPKRDAVTSLLFALSFVAIAPEHPITKSLTVAYWEPGSTIEDEILDMSDVVCAWGHETSIEPIKRRIRYGTEFVEFGPKRSLHMIGADTPGLNYVAMKAAYDISIYDQVACFSPQETFCEADPAAYVDALRTWMDTNMKRIPKPPISADEKAVVARTQREATFRGWQVIAPENSGWTIIVTEGPCRIAAHPLSRTMFIHAVKDLREALPFVDKHTQTVAIHPAERAMELADELAFRGVARITEVGRVGRPRPASPTMACSRWRAWCAGSPSNVASTSSTSSGHSGGRGRPTVLRPRRGRREPGPDGGFEGVRGDEPQIMVQPRRTPALAVLTLSDAPVIPRGASGTGLATMDGRGVVLDAWYPDPVLGSHPHTESERLFSYATPNSLRQLTGSDAGRDIKVVAVHTTIADLTRPPVDAYDAYLRLHLLSHRVIRPRKDSNTPSSPSRASRVCMRECEPAGRSLFTGSARSHEWWTTWSRSACGSPTAPACSSAAARRTSCARYHRDARRLRRL
jgi:Acyl-CoA reductase (LuxC)